MFQYISVGTGMTLVNLTITVLTSIFTSHLTPHEDSRVSCQMNTAICSLRTFEIIARSWEISLASLSSPKTSCRASPGHVCLVNRYNRAALCCASPLHMTLV